MNKQTNTTPVWIGIANEREQRKLSEPLPTLLDVKNLMFNWTII